MKLYDSLITGSYPTYTGWGWAIKRNLSFGIVNILFIIFISIILMAIYKKSLEVLKINEETKIYKGLFGIGVIASIFLSLTIIKILT